jgi:hypothetical protein
VLFLWPLGAGGPARRLGGRLALASLLGAVWAAAPGVVMRFMPLPALAATAWLMVYGVGLLAAVGWIRAETARGLAPLHESLRSLPLPARRLSCGRALLPLLPLAASLGVQQAVLWQAVGAVHPLRPAVAGLHLAVLGLSSAALLVRLRDPVHDALRQLSLFALACAVASEVLA